MLKLIKSERMPVYRPNELLNDVVVSVYLDESRTDEPGDPKLWVEVQPCMGFYEFPADHLMELIESARAEAMQPYGVLEEMSNR